jgi:hypothetical protein
MKSFYTGQGNHIFFKTVMSSIVKKEEDKLLLFEHLELAGYDYTKENSQVQREFMDEFLRMVNRCEELKTIII